MVKFNKKVILVVIVIVLVIILSVILVSKPNNSIINNQKVLDEVTRLSFITERNLTENDLKNLNLLVKNDDKVKYSIDTMYWLIRNNEAEHASHALSFINVYIQTSRLDFCMPHEIEHFGLTIKHKDFERAKIVYNILKETIPIWEEKSEKSRLKFPAYYLNYEEVKSKLNNIIKNYESNNFNQDFFEDIKYIGENGVC